MKQLKEALISKKTINRAHSGNSKFPYDLFILYPTGDDAQKYNRHGKREDIGHIVIADFDRWHYFILTESELKSIIDTLTDEYTHIYIVTDPTKSVKELEDMLRVMDSFDLKSEPWVVTYTLQDFKKQFKKYL